MKSFFPFLIVLILPFLLSAGGVPEEQIPGLPVTVRVMAPSGTPAMALSGLAVSQKELLPGYTHEIEVVNAADLVAAKMIKGEADFAVIPTNLASVLFSKGVDIKMAGIVIWGNLYVVSSKADAVWEDMKGHEVYMLGRGLSPDILLQHLMIKNGIDPQKDTTLHYVAASSELAPAFLTGKSQFSIMPEPMLSVVKTKKPDTHVMLDLQKEWSRLYNTQSGYPQACLVVSGKMVAEHPDYVEAFLAEFARSVSWMADNPVEAGEGGVILMPEMSAPVLTKSLPGCNMVFTPAKDARDDLEAYYQVLLDFDANTIGGALPGDDFYLN
jgi:NitT/TauT family transport system substrate-binding protein